MRYVSHSPKYSIGVREAEFVNIHGIVTEHVPKMIAKFQQGVALDHELEAALKAFTFRGLPDGVPPTIMISVLDTSDYQKEHKLSDEERLEIEKHIESLPSMGVDYIKVEELRAPKPWPSYDEDSEEEILSLLDRTGFDPDDLRRYEQENQNRPDLIAKLVELGAADVEKHDLEELHSFKNEDIEVRQPGGGTKHITVRA